MRSRPNELFLFAGALVILALLGVVACGDPDQAPPVLVSAVTPTTPIGPPEGALEAPATEEHNDVTRASGMDFNRPADRSGPAPGGGSTVNLTTGNTGGQAGEPLTTGAGATTLPGEPTNPPPAAQPLPPPEDAGIPPTSEESF